MSFSNLKEIFDHYCETEINRKLLESLTKWRNRFYSRNSEHVGFSLRRHLGYISRNG